MEEFKVIIYCCMYSGCYKEYQSKYNLKRHVDTNHFRKREGQCSICKKVFVNFENLREHQNIHLNVKPYTCSLCSKSFRNKCMLTRHKRGHQINVNDE